jgi:hypothetical protein
LLSCKVNKDCYHVVGEELFIINDTLPLPSVHYHVPKDNICFWLEESEIIIIDTIKIEIFEFRIKKERIRNEKK